MPLFSGQVLYILLARIELVPDPRDHATHGHYLGLFFVTAALGLAVGALWEIVEWASDSTLGSDLQLGNEDTVTDLVSDAVGAFTGAALLVAWAAYGWGSVRRIPWRKSNRGHQGLAERHGARLGLRRDEAE